MIRHRLAMILMGEAAGVLDPLGCSAIAEGKRVRMVNGSSVGVDARPAQRFRRCADLCWWSVLAAVAQFAIDFSWAVEVEASEGKTIVE